VPWDKLQLFWVDERCVAPDNPESNYGVCRELLLTKVPIPEKNVFRMEGERDPEEAASRYESTLRNVMKLEGAESPAFDLVVLGMGPDGHTASLFPNTDALNEMGRLVVANHVSQKDTWRITLTWPVINQAAEVAFEVEGPGKTEVVAEVLTGPRDPDRLPSQLIRPANGKLLFLLDKDAAAKLPKASAVAEAEGYRVGTLEI
jgi:6-phosphogluconolactonase